MTFVRRRLLSGMVTIALACSAAPVMAQSSPTNLGTFKSWTAWQGQDDYGRICFISAAPDSSEPTQINGKPINRDPVHFLVIHRDKAPAINADGTAAKDKNGNPVFRKVRNEVQTLIGYPMQPTSDSFTHSAEIDGKAWPMKSIPDDPSTPIKDDEAAWLASMDDEAGFVAALKAGTKLVVHGTSARGTKTTDTYSLAGVTAAMDAIDKACP
ncbi:MAG TPA: invasion associated locus B family protein [Devosia sp.]|nr:invasion associated locus B family protein [Devosia sp.]